MDHKLEAGHYHQCHACHLPITAADKASDKFLQGVSCPHCHDKLTAAQKTRFQERQKQMELARQRGEAHMGDAAIESSAANRTTKQQKKRRQQTAASKQAV